MTIQIQAPDGSIVEFPDGTPDDVMARAMRETFGGPDAPIAPDDVRGPNGVPGGIPAQAPVATQPKPATGALDYVDNTGSIFLDDALGGIAGMLGAPVDLMNNAPRLANILPGVDGVGPIAALHAALTHAVTYIHIELKLQWLRLRLQGEAQAVTAR